MNSRRLSIAGCNLATKKRKQKGLTIKNVATEIHIGEATAKRFFRRNPVSHDIFKRMCEFLDICSEEVEEKEFDEKQIKEIVENEYKDKLKDLEHEIKIKTVELNFARQQLNNYHNSSQTHEIMIEKFMEENSEQRKTINHLLEIIRNNGYTDISLNDKFKDKDNDNEMNQRKDMVRFNIHNSGTGKVHIGNIYHSTIHNNKKQDLAEAAAEIQRLLEQLEKTYSNNDNFEKKHSYDSASGKLKLASNAIEEIEKNSTFKKRVISALKNSGEMALEEAIDHPIASFLVGAIAGWGKAS